MVPFVPVRALLQPTLPHLTPLYPFGISFLSIFLKEFIIFLLHPYGIIIISSLLLLV